MTNIKTYRIDPMHFFFVIALIVSEMLKCQMFETLKSRSSSWSTIFAMTPINCKCQNLQTSFCIIAKIRPVRTIVTHTRTHTNIHTETDMAMAIGEMAVLPRNF